MTEKKKREKFRGEKRATSAPGQAAERQTPDQARNGRSVGKALRGFGPPYRFELVGGQAV